MDGAAGAGAGVHALAGAPALRRDARHRVRQREGSAEARRLRSPQRPLPRDGGGAADGAGAVLYGAGGAGGAAVLGVVRPLGLRRCGEGAAEALPDVCPQLDDGGEPDAGAPARRGLLCHQEGARLDGVTGPTLPPLPPRLPAPRLHQAPHEVAAVRRPLRARCLRSEAHARRRQRRQQQRAGAGAGCGGGSAAGQPDSACSPTQQRAAPAAARAAAAAAVVPDRRSILAPCRGCLRRAGSSSSGGGHVVGPAHARRTQREGHRPCVVREARLQAAGRSHAGPGAVAAAPLRRRRRRRWQQQPQRQPAHGAHRVRPPQQPQRQRRRRDRLLRLLHSRGGGQGGGAEAPAAATAVVAAAAAARAEAPCNVAAKRRTDRPQRAGNDPVEARTVAADVRHAPPRPARTAAATAARAAAAQRGLRREHPPPLHDSTGGPAASPAAAAAAAPPQHPALLPTGCPGARQVGPLRAAAAAAATRRCERRGARRNGPSDVRAASGACGTRQRLGRALRGTGGRSLPCEERPSCCRTCRYHRERHARSRSRTGHAGPQRRRTPTRPPACLRHGEGGGGGDGDARGVRGASAGDGG
eukprot:Rhum_TRINITY_DN14159_c4_g1::Rhum_TRINITY_DN14159_c4_g1_i1::g.71184::m.71184